MLDKEIKIQSSIRDNLLNKKLNNLNEFKETSSILKINSPSEKPKNRDLIHPNNNTISHADVKKLSNFITKQKSCLIIDSALNDFRYLKKKFENSTIEKDIKSSFIETIIVKFDPLDVNDSTSIRVRVTSDFYTLLDLLIEICSIQGLNYKNFDLYDEQENKLSLTQTVKRYISSKQDESISRFVFLKKKINYNNSNSNDTRYNTDYKLLNNNQNNFDEIKILSDDLVTAEDTALTNFKDINFYFVLLVCVFIFSLNRFGIENKYFIDSAVRKNIFEKKFFANNRNDLQNTFENLINSELLYEWLNKVYLNIFEYKGKLHNFYNFCFD